MSDTCKKTEPSSQLITADLPIIDDVIQFQIVTPCASALLSLRHAVAEQVIWNETRRSKDALTSC